MKKFGWLFLILLFPSWSFAFKSIGSLPVQDLGRVKPFESFARESLQLLYGRQTFKLIQKDEAGKEITGKRSATEVIFTMMFLPEVWTEQNVLVIDNRALKQSLKVDPEQKYFTFSELVRNPRVGLLVRELEGRVSRKENLDTFSKAVQSLNNQLTLMNAIMSQRAIAVLPPPSDAKTDRWLSAAELQGEAKEKFSQIFLVAAKNTPKKRGESFSKEGQKAVGAAVKEFIDYTKAQRGESYAPFSEIKAELWLHNFQPFLWAWVLYLLSALLLLVSWLNENKKLYLAGWGFALVALVIHTIGFLVRVYIVKRPPVSNMYETVVWAPWGTVLFAMILEYVYRKRIVLLAANIAAILCLILASLAPTVLDPSLQPLEPVLRSTFWLLTHVLVIVISYGAYFLSWAIGNFVITAAFIDEEKYKTQIKDGALAIYRSNQIGTVLLFAGIILGGVWADYSWGRFWGWDPKETWALIAFLGYVAVLHARLTNWIRDFGNAAASVAAFSLVVMAWYGVNYVLGAGLHSYGFGAGGVEYVASVVVAQLLYVAFVAKVRQSRLQEAKEN
tara:strand:- start:57322 stop:59001 length:1680 start_codon:yes stop_codon:yes gene_type:complete